MKDPNFDIAFSIGRFHIYWYAILLALGIAAALMITDRRAKGRAVPKDIALDLCILGLPFGILGARLFACLSGSVPFSRFLDLTKPGLSFFGGIVMAAAAILVYLKHKKVPLGEMLDILSPGVFAGIGISVWGDFFNRIHYGPLVERASHKWFPLATFGSDLTIHYAAFFYEFLLCVALILLYYTTLRKKVARKEDRFLWMALLYCIVRFGIDGIRQDLVMVGAIAFDQLCEIVLAVLCLLLLFLKKPAQLEQAETAEPSAHAADEQAVEPSPNVPEKEAADRSDEAQAEAGEPLPEAEVGPGSAASDVSPDDGEEPAKADEPSESIPDVPFSGLS